MAGAAVIAYLYVVIRNDVRRAPAQLAWAGGSAPVMVMQTHQEQECTFVALRSRGGLVVLTLKDDEDHNHRWVWWPDTLDAAGRRALRLAASIGVEPAPTRTTSLNSVV